MKKKVILLIISITLILVILFSSSYALLFKSDTTDKQSYTTGVLSITSETTNNSVTLNNSLPMSDSDGANTTPYTFKITNTGNLSYKFNVMLLSTTTENQISAEYIKIKVNDNEITKLSDLTDGIILSDITLKPEENIEISLRVWLDENTPNTEIGKNFNAKITTEGEAVYTSNDKKALETLTKLGLTQNAGTPDITKTSCTSGCEESIVGIYSAEDDFGTSYYFRGDVENNYFYFAGFYWRIIRINGDGSIRMIYDGTSAHTNGESSTDRQVGTSAFNSDRADNAYVGYMYGTAGSTTYEATHANTNDSTIKNILDIWYNNNLKDTSYEQYIADAIYCNDREISSGTGIGSTQTVYGNSTSLKCNQVNDRFTINTNVDGVTGNGTLTNPIGLITGDEISFSGGEHENSYLYTGSAFWSMTPISFVYNPTLKLDTSANVDMFEYNKDGSVTIPRVSTSTIGVRPVISIDSSVSISGTGTMTDPFMISAAKSTLTRLGLSKSDGTPNFSKTSCTSGCEESTVGIYFAEDDLGTSYYFRGNVENNYVYFAGYYWRIIRINGDGTIRMIYDGTTARDNGDEYSAVSTESGRYYFNTPGGDNTYVGYMYGTAGATTYAATHANTNDSIIKQTLDTWYENHISGTTNEQYVEDAIYCNDREVTKNISGYTGNGYGTSVTAYKPYERIFVNNSPSLKCKQVNDRFTKSTSINGVATNGKLKYAIGLITADEVVYAGTSSSKSNTKNYLYSTDGYFTMTPYDFYSTFSYERIIGVSGGGFWEDTSTGDVLRKSRGARPVISLKVDALSSGTGIKSDPFKVS